MNTEQNEKLKATPFLEQISLRDYFAAKAMHQFLTGLVLPPEFDAKAVFAVIAERAYEAADAMIKTRSLN